MGIALRKGAGVLPLRPSNAGGRVRPSETSLWARAVDRVVGGFFPLPVLPLPSVLILVVLLPGMERVEGNRIAPRVQQAGEPEDAADHKSPAEGAKDDHDD